MPDPAKPTAKLSSTGRLRLEVRLYATNAASNANSPCAKLSTRLVRYSSTIPSAINV